ncbi:MAG: hypothetical protein AB7F98_11555 [Novosphingobium sp.]
MNSLGILIPLAPFLMVCFIVWTRHQGKIAEMQLKAAAEKAADNASHSRELEERVRVLERIVTDKGYDVATQIEALRDTRLTEGIEQAAEPLTKQ